ncbi:MAG TPA: hypothetical protein VMA34_02110 [Terracidiphilus sp.]|nr:hypothetical protein [Terracidiphilus sp.]
MLKGPTIQALSGLLLFACTVPGYGAQKFPDFPVRQPGNYSISAQQDEVSVGLDPVESVQDQLTYFHTALSPKGFLPVFVVVHNGSKLDSLLLDKSGISYGLDKEIGSGPKENTAGQKAAIVSSAFIPFIGGFISLGMAEDASGVKQNLILQELQSETLSPGDTAHGFLYIPIPKKGPLPKIQIQVPIAWTRSDKTSVVHLDF